MSFGFEIRNESGAVQVTSQSPLYACIYSGVVENKALNEAVLRKDDIIATTQITSGGLYYNHLLHGRITRTLKGRSRVVVFRRADTEVTTHAATFGVEVYGVSGATTYSSYMHPLHIGLRSNGYAALIFQGSHVDRIGTGNNQYHYTHEGTNILSNGSFTTFTESGWYAYGGAWRKPTFFPKRTVIDVSHIPLNFTTGIITSL